jgi:hypothetical protein
MRRGGTMLMLTINITLKYSATQSNIEAINSVRIGLIDLLIDAFLWALLLRVGAQLSYNSSYLEIKYWGSDILFYHIPEPMDNWDFYIVHGLRYYGYLKS